MDISPVSGADERQTCFDIFFSSVNDLHDRAGVARMDPADGAWLHESLARFEVTDGDTLVLAREGGEPIAFGCAFRRDDFWFLAYLFVATHAQGRGVGRGILEHLIPSAGERATLQLGTAVESVQPISTMLYATYGITPRLPLYNLKDLAALDRLPRLGSGVNAAEISPQHAAAIDALDRDLLGYTRRRDHDIWGREAAVARAYVDADGSLAGYGYFAADGFVGPIGSTDEDLTGQIVGDLLTGYRGATKDVTIPVGGASGKLLATLLRSGFRAEDRPPLVYCSSGPLPHPGYVMYAPFLP